MIHCSRNCFVFFSWNWEFSASFFSSLCSHLQFKIHISVHFGHFLSSILGKPFSPIFTKPNQILRRKIALESVKIVRKKQQQKLSARIWKFGSMFDEQIQWTEFYLWQFSLVWSFSFSFVRLVVCSLFHRRSITFDLINLFNVEICIYSKRIHTPTSINWWANLYTLNVSVENQQQNEK